jgi:hypothetical protein
MAPAAAPTPRMFDNEPRSSDVPVRIPIVVPLAANG